MNTIIEYSEMHTIDRSIQSSSSLDNQQSDPELHDMKSFCFFIPFLHLRRIAPALSSPSQACFYLGLLPFASFTITPLLPRQWPCYQGPTLSCHAHLSRARELCG